MGFVGSAVSVVTPRIIGGIIDPGIDPATLPNSVVSLDTFDEDSLSIKTGAEFISASSQYLETVNTTYDFADVDFSLSFWVNLNSTASTQWFCGKWNGTGNQRSYGVQIDTIGKPTFLVSADGATFTSISALTNLVVGTWSLVTVYHDSVADEIGIKINTDAYATAAHTGGAFVSTSPFRIGTRADNVQFVDGKYDGFTIWNKKLTDADVLGIYADGNGQNFFDISKTGLIEYYSLNEVSGTRFGSNSGINLTEFNGVLATLGIILDRGIDNNFYAAAQFTAANSEYLSSSDTDFNLGTAGDSFTTFGWFRPDTVNTVHGLVSKWNGNNSNRSYRLRISASNIIQLSLSNDGVNAPYNLLSATPISNANTWYFFVAGYDQVNDVAFISVNGGNREEIPATGNLFNASVDLVLSGFNDPVVNNLNGRLDNVGFYKKALTNAEIIILYASGLGQNFFSVSKTDLLSYWSLNEVSGTRFDQFGGNHLTDNNTVTGADGVVEEIFGQNKLAKAAQFTAANSEYLSSNNAAFGFSDEDFSFSGWVNIDATSTWILTRSSGSSDRGYALVISGSTLTWRVSDNGSSLTSVVSSVTVSTDKWYHITIYHDAVNNEIGISVNNETFVTAVHSTGLNVSAADLQIGAKEGFNTMSGRFDTLVCYAKAVSQAENETLYNNGKGQTYDEIDKTNLLSYWSLNEESGTRFDSHINNLNLTDNNTVTGADGQVLDILSLQGRSYPVSYWADRTGNGNHYVQDSLSIRPEYFRDTKVVRFIAANSQALECINGSTPFESDIKGEIIMIASRGDQASNGMPEFGVGDSTSTTEFFLIQHTNSASNQARVRVRNVAGNNTGSITLITPDDQIILYNIRSNAVVWGIAIDGVEQVVTVFGINGLWVAALNSADKSTIGIQPKASPVYSDGDVQSIQYSNDVYINQAQRDEINKFLNSKYNVY